jgi:hypothetical protein
LPAHWANSLPHQWLSESVLPHLARRPARPDKTDSSCTNPFLDRLQWAVLTEDPNGDNKAAGYLAAAYATPYASRTVRTWLSQPIDHPARAARVPSWLRQFLNPSDTSLQTTQARAFELLILPLAHTRETLNQPVTAAASSEEHAQDRTNSVLVADHIIERVYFASAQPKKRKGISRPGPHKNSCDDSPN